MKSSFLNFYKYCFYRFYTTAENSDFVFWSEWKASIMATLLFFVVFYDFLIFLFLVTRINLFAADFSWVLLLVVFGVLSAIEYSSFIHQEKWKEIVQEFDALPNVLQRRKKWTFRLFILVVIVVLVIGFYLVYLLRKDSY